MVKVLPLTKYPFLNVQNQIYDFRTLNGHTQITKPDFLKTFYNGFNMTENDYFQNAPHVNTAYGIGSLNWTVRLSKDCFYQGLPDFNILDMRNINFLVFYDETRTNTSYTFSIDKFYYFVEDVKQINASMYEYTLSLDPIKTYFDLILRFKRVSPLRYHQRINDYFDFTKYTNKDIVDPLLPIPRNATLKTYLTRYFMNRDGVKHSFSFIGMWSYFYMSYNTNDERRYTSFEREDYYIVALPKKYSSPNSSYGALKKELLKSPHLLKVVDSPFHPFTSLIDNDVFSKIIMTFNKEDETLTIDFKYNDEVGDAISYYLDSTHLQVFKFSESNIFLPHSLKEAITSGFSYGSPLFIVRKNHRSQSHLVALDSSLNLVNEFQPFDYMTPTVELSQIRNSLRQNLVNKQLGLLFNINEVGFANSNKMLVNNNVHAFHSEIKYRIYGDIVHSLFNTEEILSFRDYITDREIDVEYRIKRGYELNYSKITNDYYNYVYMNQNALKQKGEMLNKWNDISTIASSVIGIGSTVALAVATGGTSLPVSLGVGVGGFNLVKNLFDNEMKRKSHEAQLKDKSLTPEKFEGGNYNANDTVLSYLPIFSSYRQTNKVSNDFTYFDTYGLDYEISSVISEFGFYTPLKNIEEYDSLMFSNLFTRRYYNYIQLQDTDNIELWDGEYFHSIPNEHLRLIFSIFENGVRFHHVFKLYNEEAIQNPEL